MTIISYFNLLLVSKEMIKGGSFNDEMKERVEWLKQWFQLYKKQLLIGILALIVVL